MTKYYYGYYIYFVITAMDLTIYISLLNKNNYPSKYSFYKYSSLNYFHLKAMVEFESLNLKIFFNMFYRMQI